MHTKKKQWTWLCEKRRKGRGEKSVEELMDGKTISNETNRPEADEQRP